MIRRIRARAKRGSAFIASSTGSSPAATVVATSLARGTSSSGRAMVTAPALTSGRMAASPKTPAPRCSRSRNVSA